MRIVDFSDDDLRALRRLAYAERNRRQNPVNRRYDQADDPPSTEIYVAKTPAAGIPGLTYGSITGTGTGTGTEDQPGIALCDLYRIIGSPDSPLLFPITGNTRFVHNLSVTDIPGNTWIIVVRDKYGDWYAVGGGGLGAVTRTYVTPIAVVSAQSFEASCPYRTGCLPRYFYCTVDTYDVECGEWLEPSCGFAFDINSERLELGRRYEANLVGRLPPILSADNLPPGYNCNWDVDETPLYAVDVGDISRLVVVESRVEEQYCATGTSTDLTASLGDEDRLTLYRGYAKRWNPTLCAWEVSEDDILIASFQGCGLTIGTTFQGHYETQVPDNLIGLTGSANDGCHPLYLVDYKQEAPKGIADIQCVNGKLYVYVYQATGNCGYEVVFSHTAGCCDCADWEGTGTGTGGSVSCCGRELSDPLFAVIAGESTIQLDWDGTYWIGSGTISCGETLYLRFNTSCTLDYSCDGSNWVGATAPFGANNDCGPPFKSLAWDVNADDGLAGCTIGVCGILSVVVSE